MFISYAQNFEDVILWRALKDVKDGFYIDVGAQDPVVDSVSLAFYEQGWRGVHVEPSRAYADALRKARADEVIIEAVVSDQQGDVPFFEIAGTGLSTANHHVAARHAAQGRQVASQSIFVIRLAAILDSYRDREIHWLKIDVEGEELSVLRSWLPSPVRPWVVVVESADPFSHDDTSAAWEPELLGLGYHIAHADGLNRFYVSERFPKLADVLALGPNVFDGFALSGTSSAPFCSRLTSQLTATSNQLRDSSAREMDLQARLIALEAESQRNGVERADLQTQLVSLQATTRQLESQHIMREEGFRAELATQLDELVRLRQVISEQNRWGENVIREADALRRQVFDFQRSTSWRVTGPFRGAARGARRCGTLLTRLLAALARRTAVLLHDMTPRFYSALLKSQRLRRIYLQLATPRPSTLSALDTPKQPIPLNAVSDQPSQIGLGRFSQYDNRIDTRGQIMNAMVRWRKEKRVHA